MTAMQKKKQERRETSKGIVTAVLVIFTASMMLSYVLPIFFQYMCDNVLQMLQTVSTLTGSILIGYFGKAGFENYDKNKKCLKFLKEDSDEDGGEDG